MVKRIFLRGQPFLFCMELTKKDEELIEKAERLVGEKKVSGGVVKEVGSALLTEKGEIFTGANLDLWCGIGFCAEHSAIAQMISHSDETQIKSIVAVYYDKKDETFKIIPPCGRCRELMELIDKRNRENTTVIVSESKKMKLKELLPAEWM